MDPPPPFSLKRRIKLTRYREAYFGRGRLAAWLRRYVVKHEKHRSLLAVSPDPHSRILDVGCGSGVFLRDLRDIGFLALTGIDPNLENDIRHSDGLALWKRDITEVEGQFDIIMFHHSFEHMIDPAMTLRAATAKLADGGVCLIRIPTVSSYAWKCYREHWVQLDAPRHLYLHSIESMCLLGRQAGLRWRGFYSDATPMQFWGSEQCKRGISLNSISSYGKNPTQAVFLKNDIARFKTCTRELNAINFGDQAAFFFYRQEPPDSPATDCDITQSYASFWTAHGAQRSASASISLHTSPFAP